MPESSHIFQKKTHYHGRKLDQDSIEDRKLLGNHFNDDAQAIIIKKPYSTGRANMPAKVINPTAVKSSVAEHQQLPNGGPRPTNTLNRSNNLPDIRNSRNSTLKDLASKQKALNLTAIRGDNVLSKTPDPDLSNGFSGLPSAKRRKVDSASSRSTSSGSVDEAFKSITGDQYRAIANQPREPRNSIEGRRRDFIPRTRPSLGVDEYYRVENMMRSGSERPKKMRDPIKNTAPEGQSFSNASSPLLDALSRRNSMIAVDDEETEPVPVSYPQRSPTAKNVAQPQLNDASKEQHPASSIELSPYFSKPSNRTPDLGSWKAKLDKPDLQIKTAPQNVRLSSQFVQANGKRRGGQLPTSSPDELTFGTTVGNQTDPKIVSPHKRARTESSSKTSSSTLKLSVLNESPVTMEPSNIRASKFSATSSHKKKRLSQETPAEWAIDLIAVNHAGIGSDGRSQDLGLVYDTKSDTYKIYQQGSPLISSGVALKIIPQKLYKILWEEGGRKIHFMSSRIGNEDNVLQIEVATEKNMLDLLARVQRKNALSVVGKSSDKMEQIFAQRRNTSTSTRDTRQSTIADSLSSGPTSTTVSRTCVNQQRASEAGTIGRARTGIVSTLLDRALDQDDKPDPLSRSRTSGVPSSSTKAGSEPQSKISSILDGLRPEHNSHLRRSTRTSNASGTSRENFEDPEVPKYSKTHGLGLRWKKPLTYPEMGKKKATVDWVDLERLDEGEMLNDTLVTFYMRYLEHQVEQQSPDLAKRIYFFSTFFYERLTSSLKGRKEINYEAVQKWTRSVDIFTYDYIVVPINEQAHWYLAVICNLPALHRMQHDMATREIREQPNVSSPATPRDSNVLTEQIAEPTVSDREESAEQGTTNSFAEMSLETNAVPRDQKHETEAIVERRHAAIGMQEIRIGDEEMRDVSNEKPSGATEQDAQANAVAHQGHDSDPIDDADRKSQGQSTPRKQKRKSLPPVTNTDPQRPLIVTLDSLGSPHPLVIKTLKDYLFKEGKAKRGGMELDVGSIKGINAKCIPLQDNFSDCGLYMLGYVKKFLFDNPPDFIAKIIKREYKKDDWIELIPGNMRTSLRDQLQELHRQQEEGYQATKTKRKIVGDIGTSSPIKTPAASTLEPSQVQPSPTLKNSPALNSPTRKEALEGAHPIKDIPIDEVAKQHVLPRRPGPSHQDHHHVVRVPLADITPDESSLILVESQSQSQSRRQSQVDVPSSLLMADVQQNNLESEVSGLPSEIEDSQPAINGKIEVPLGVEYMENFPLDMTRQVQSHSERKGSLTHPNRGKRFGRPKKHQEELAEPRDVREIQTVVLD